MVDRKTAILDTTQNILIGIGGSIQVQIEGSKQNFQSVLIGLEENDFLIIKFPVGLVDETPVARRLMPGEKIQVRYLYDGTVYAFQSEIISNLTIPRKIIFISFPEKVAKHELRKCKRWDCIIPAKMAFATATVSGTITDISDAGCCCLVNAMPDLKPLAVKVGDAVDLSFKLPSREIVEQVHGTVRNVRREDQELNLGIEFKQKIAEFEDKIFQYIYK